jgi:hypothetical protein
VQRERQVRTVRGSEEARGTHSLESAERDKSGVRGVKGSEGTHILESVEVETSQDGAGKQGSEGHSRPEEHKGRGKSGRLKGERERGALTSWKAQREGQVRTTKGREHARGTHFLDSAEVETIQDGERK